MNLAQQRETDIRQRLAALSPSTLEITDESHLHVGHAGAKTGLGHFRVKIVSEQFRGLTPMQRHKRVYEALGTLLQTDIHAISIDAQTPSNPL